MAVPAAFAVTDKEMDQARAIAAHAYLRYANDGSGYLDAVHPKSMAELEKVLKNKEKENLKAFKNIPVPSDYASWDKKQLVEYWSDKAFATKGLLDKGKIGKSRAKKNLNAMTVTAPAAKETPKEAPAATASTEKPQTDASSQANTAKTGSSTSSALPEAATDSLSKEAEAILDAENQLFADLEEEPQMSKAKDHTWIYVVILCLLVGVVVALVVFASNVMKKNAARAAGNNGMSQKNDPVYSGDSNAMREKFAATLAAKNEEIANLSQKLELLNSQNKSLKTSLEKLTAEVASLRTRLSEASHKLSQHQEEAKQTPQSQQPIQRQHQPITNQPEPKTAAVAEPEVQKPKVRSIYLGRVNNKGLFTRADRTLKPGLSIYRLDTTDGYVGTFRVAQDPEVWETALRAPIEILGGGCIAPDITSTAGKSRIINDSAGTTIYDGEAWKVTRKAKVHFE